MPSRPGELSGLKLLLVEDNFLVAEHMCSLLTRHGCDVIGPAPRVAKALELIEDAPAIDGAMLDVNLRGEWCFPIARALAKQRIPFLFLTGYEDASIIPQEFADALIVPKPIDEDAFVAVVWKRFSRNG